MVPCRSWDPAECLIIHLPPPLPPSLFPLILPFRLSPPFLQDPFNDSKPHVRRRLIYPIKQLDIDNMVPSEKHRHNCKPGWMNKSTWWDTIKRKWKSWKSDALLGKLKLISKSSFIHYFIDFPAPFLTCHFRSITIITFWFFFTLPSSIRLFFPACTLTLP